MQPVDERTITEGPDTDQKQQGTHAPVTLQTSVPEQSAAAVPVDNTVPAQSDTGAAPIYQATPAAGGDIDGQGAQ